MFTPLCYFPGTTSTIQREAAQKMFRKFADMLAVSCALDLAETKLKIVIGFVVQIKDVVDKNEVIQNENENYA
jgi:hypothetical protein